MQTEIDTEVRLCYANPVMLEVWKELIRRDKDIVVISDMYLPSAVLEEILHRNGYKGYKKLYVSCEYGKNKATGSLYKLVYEELGNRRIIHVGDNPHSDVKMAKKYGFAVCPYENVNHNSILYRPYDMSYMIGSAYRGIVSNRLYNGMEACSMEYEYGFIYGGLFVLGYCEFIHKYCSAHDIDTLLFLSRDGDILKQVYDYLYPEEDTKYVYWSRKAATVLMADEDRHDYFRRYIYHKVNQNYTIRDILSSMQLEFLCEELGSRQDDELTDKNGYLLRRFIEARWDKVLASYADNNEAARAYYEDVLRDSHSAAAIDIGWAGSGAISLAHLVTDVWKIPCTITGIVAGTNTLGNSEPDASETFLQDGRLVAYLYSQRHNRDLLKKHDPNKDYNVFWELLLSSPTPQFVGFGRTLTFGRYDANQDGIRSIQRGILDFVSDYRTHFKDYPYMFNISGRDAYAPMLVAASYDEKYLKTMEKKFGLNVNVD